VAGVKHFGEAEAETRHFRDLVPDGPYRKTCGSGGIFPKLSKRTCFFRTQTGGHVAVTTQERPVATLASVAASAGVSIATVSKVLNRRADVGPETRARVQALLKESEYVGRRAESAADRTPKQAIIEFLFHGELSAYSLEVLQGVVDAGTEAGVSIAVSVRSRDRRHVGVKPSAAWVRDLTRLGRYAVIDVVDDVRRGDLSALTGAPLPLVVIDPLSLPHPDVASVGTTNFAGGMAATQHLLSLGHTRIGYLGAGAGAAYNTARMHGYRAALEAAGVEVSDEYILGGGPSYDDGLAGGGRLLDVPERPTAVFVATDETAAGMVEAARTRNLRVPEDLSVVGFDDNPLARLLSPPLTTVRQPLREMGRLAVQTALRLAAGEKLDSHHVELATELILRSSTAPPKQPTGRSRRAARSRSRP
jgi:LacI family transcriptional regulator